MNKYLLIIFVLVIFGLMASLLVVSVELEKQKTTSAILTNNLANANEAIINQNEAIRQQQDLINRTKLDESIRSKQITYVFVQNATCEELLNETYQIQMNGIRQLADIVSNITN